MSVLNYCFNNLSSIHSVSYNQQRAYKIAWNTFRTVEIYNSNVSTQRGQGDSNATYYQFQTTELQTQYKEGQSMFYYYFGYSNVVKKN
jgi:hypothetical protein